MHLRLLLAAALFLFLAAPAPALTIEKFARFNDDDAAEFVSELVAGAAKYLRTHGQPAQADRAIALFKDPGKNGGVAQFAYNLKTISTANTRHSDNPNNRAPVLEVEDALARTFHDAGIKEVPVSVLKSIAAGFQPVGPPRSFAPPTHAY